MLKHKMAKEHSIVCCYFSSMRNIWTHKTCYQAVWKKLCYLNMNNLHTYIHTLHTYTYIHTYKKHKKLFFITSLSTALSHKPETPRATRESYRAPGHDTVYLTNSWSRVHPENLTGRHPVTKFPALYETRKFITAFTNAHYMSLYWERSMKSMPIPQLEGPFEYYPSIYA
jgi:hypothetical protein